MSSSSWLEGRCCELARFGYSWTGKRANWQIVYVLCAGCPWSCWHTPTDELFDANDKLKERFGLSALCWSATAA